MTGYTVFSTVHAASVRGVIQRLSELGLSHWEIKNALSSVVYQRLIAGKGVLDIAKNEFESWSSENWNKKIDQLLTNGYLTSTEAKREKIKTD